MTFYPYRHVTRADFGDAWPLTVEAGTLQLRGKSVVFLTDRKVYAVNGTAKADRHWILDQPRYVPIDEIWADAPNPPGLDLRFKVNMGPLIKAGLALGRASAPIDASAIRPSIAPGHEEQGAPRIAHETRTIPIDTIRTPVL